MAITMTTTKMTTESRPRRKRRPGKPLGARALLLTLAMGGVLSGWAGLAITATREEGAVDSTGGIPASAVGNSSPVLALPPIPTVHPPPSGLAIGDSAPERLLAPIPAVPQPVRQRPLARTRSSR